MIDGGPGDPVDGIKEQTPCDLHDVFRNVSVKVAVGYVLPAFGAEGEPATWHGNEIPAGYAHVGVDSVVPSWETLQLDIPGGFNQHPIAAQHGSHHGLCHGRRLRSRALAPHLVPPDSAASRAKLLAIGLPRRRNAPPGPAAVPVFGNWLQVGNDLNHRLLARLSARYGPVFRLRLGVRNLVVVSDPRLATEVLHTQGVEFGSRPRNVVFDIFTTNGSDMVFTEYGDHWRRMRRVMTLPFFTARVVQQYRAMWEAEMDHVVSDPAIWISFSEIYRS
ncbi:hypothetical protein QYE76_020394 [Lolium multiflorum]|uniref:DUF8039 domain-containing protein n=1 Tax=Lolium multiflorum TaxID=4521 RepID=A0AAD8R6Y8_LOLMU|nr:hypothetical protein QYE76_020394 [Lolium multiflorum]